jgi:hypothetical protein
MIEIFPKAKFYLLEKRQAEREAAKNIAATDPFNE